MARRATESDENRRDFSYDFYGRGVEEVVSALERLRPCWSLIRIARSEPINVTRPSDEEGREHVGVRKLAVARSAIPRRKGRGWLTQ